MQVLLQVLQPVHIQVPLPVLQRVPLQVPPQVLLVAITIDTQLHLALPAQVVTLCQV